MTNAAVLRRGSEIAHGIEVVAHLRRGRRLDVYDAWSTGRHCRCIVKTLRPDRAHDLEAASRLTTEGELLALLGHPHLVRAYETVTTSECARPAVVLETLQGATVEALMRQHHGLSPLDVALLGAQLSSVLRYLHRAGWLHLDVKPSNIVASEGRAVLIDLSLAVMKGSAGALGTFDYLSPEQAVRGPVTEKTDVWGLGATLYASLTGRPPYADWRYDEDSPEDTRYPQIDSAPEPLERRAAFPQPIRDVVTACLHLEPGRRPDLEEVSAALASFGDFDPRRVGAQPVERRFVSH